MVVEAEKVVEEMEEEVVSMEVEVVGGMVVEVCMAVDCLVALA